MATIKSFTSLEQSKKLAEFLPLESADMAWYPSYAKDGYSVRMLNDTYPLHIIGGEHDEIPAWSLSSLLDVLPNNKHITTTLSRGGWKIEPVEYIDKWFCEYEDEDSPSKNFSVSADNPVDACVEMILKLNELKML